MQTLLDTIRRISNRWAKSKDSLPPRKSVDSSRELLPGMRWGRFEIISKLGKGSFGSVYHARDIFERDVALKLLDSPEAIREGKILAQVKHPNIVTVFSCEQSEDSVALSMEFIEGRNLEEFVNENGKLDPTYASVIGTILCRALAVIHRKGLIHRDIKPSNIMRQSDGRIVLIDFGLGKTVVQTGGSDEIAGTLPYMAPELFDRKSPSVATDLYAVGVVLFYLISGQFPVTGNSYSSFQEAHRAKDRLHLLDLRPDLPPEFIDAIETAAHPSPEKRFRSAGAMAAALEVQLQVRRRIGISRLFGWSSIVAVILVFGGWVSWKLRERAPDIEPELVRLTPENALSLQPTLSADGKLLAYSSDQGQSGSLSIWIKQIPDGASMRLTRGFQDDSSPAFSADGHWIAFRSERDGGAIYIISALGGEERLVARGGYDPKFSPDGKLLSYWIGEGGHPRTPSGRLYIVPSGGGEPHQLAAEMADARNPIWAPDSQHILFRGSMQPQVTPEENSDWWLVDVDGSAPVKTGALARFKLQGLEVHTDAAYWYGDFLVFSAAKQANVNIWHAPFSINNFGPGPARRLTVGSAFETSPWVDASGDIVFAQEQNSLRIWSVNLDRLDGRPAKQKEAITNSADFDAFPSVSDNGIWLSFTRTSSETGHRELWVKELSSGKETKLTQNAQSKYNPAINPGGTRIAFNVAENNTDSIYAIDRDTRAVRKLCTDCGIVNAWSRDGSAILATSRDVINSIDVQSGNVTIVLTRPGLLVEDAEWSPDGKWITFSAHGPGQDRQVFVSKASETSLSISLRQGAGWADKPHWSSDGNWLYFYSNRDGYTCIWKANFRYRSATIKTSIWPVQHFHNTRLSPSHISQPVRTFAVRGNRLFANVAELTASIWMRTEQRQ